MTARAVDAATVILTDETVEFLDVETATAQEDLAATVNDLSDQFQGLFVPQEGPETYFEIPRSGRARILPSTTVSCPSRTVPPNGCSPHTGDGRTYSTPTDS